jgi:hypothetical protein
MAIVRDSYQRLAQRQRFQWSRGVQNELTRKNLDDLATGAIPAIYLYSFLGDYGSRAIRDVFSRCIPEFYKKVVPQILKYGPTVFEHDFNARQHYFARARTAEKLLSSIWPDAASPLDLFRDSLQECCSLPVGLARDGTFGAYFAGTLRSIEEGTPVHIDFAPHESPGWEMISSVEAQFAANVYLEAPGSAGNLVIYDRVWTPEHERYKLKGRFGYDDTVVCGTSFEVIAPAEGALVLFNSRFFHRVEETGGRRLTYSFFFGFHQANIIVWS